MAESPAEIEVAVILRRKDWECEVGTLTLPLTWSAEGKLEASAVEAAVIAAFKNVGTDKP